MKSFFFFLVLLPAVSLCQQQNAGTDNIPNQFGDSIAAHMLSEKYFVSHQLMVPFTEGSTADLDNFWTYLLSELHYKTASPNKLVLTPAKSGLTTNFFKYEGVLPTQGITVNLNCDRNGSNLQAATITGNYNLLTELFVTYFNGIIPQNSPRNGGFYTAYTTTDEVRLMQDKIMIQPRHKTGGTK